MVVVGVLGVVVVGVLRVVVVVGVLRVGENTVSTCSRLAQSE